MVYKKYIKKNGKVYGPYIYQSSRVNGKVVSNYHGKEKNSKRNLIFGSLICLGILLFSLVLFSNHLLTGKASLNLGGISVGENLEGVLKLTLVQGEFIPASTMVIAKIGNKSYVSSLDKLIDDSVVIGNYSVEGKSLLGRGTGYGYGDIYPKVSFVLDVYLQDEYRDDSDINMVVNESSEIISNDSFNNSISNETIANLTDLNESFMNDTEPINQSDEIELNESESFKINEDNSSILNEEFSENETGVVSEEIISPNNSESGELSENENSGSSLDGEIIEEKDDIVDISAEDEVVLGDFSITGNIVKGLFKVSNSFLGLTGNVVLGKEIDGEVSFGSPYVYNLSARQTAKIISSSEEVKLKIKGDEAIVTTNYKGESEKEFLIDLSKLDILAEEGELEIRFVYSDSEILSIKKSLTFSGGEDNLTISNLSRINFTETDVFVNETLSNETIINTNLTMEINTTQYGAVLNSPVKWKKKIKLNKESNVNVQIPKDATNIVVYRLNGFLHKKNEYDSYFLNETNSDERGLIENNETNSDEILDEDILEPRSLITAQVISGEISADIDLNEKSIFSKFFGKLSNFLTGRVIDSIEEAQDVLIDEGGLEFEIEYETPAPISFEENTARGKKIIISSETHYQNILAYTYLHQEVNLGVAKLYHIDNGSRELVSVDEYDTNENGLVDYIEWVVPHLSNQSYELIIEISKAEHLDSNKTFVSDIYDEVKAKDGVWSELINDSEYVRVFFEKELDSSRDITLYARSVNGTSSIEVYKKDSEDLIAIFENVLEENWYKVYLKNLIGEEEVFDLKINGSVEFDYIVDPITSIEFVPPTPDNSSNQTNTDIYVNYTLTYDTGSAYSFLNFDNSLVGWWRFDNDSSVGENDSLIYDWSGNGNNGSVTDAVFNSSGRFGGTYSFDGSGDYITIGTGSDYSDLCVNGCSFSFWMYVFGTGSNWAVIGRNDNTDDDTFFSIYASGLGDIYASVDDDGDNVNICTTYPIPEDFNFNEWEHITVVYNKTKILIYKNSVFWEQSDDCSFSSINETAWQDSEDTFIGTYDDSSFRYPFNGSLDEVLMFNRSLSEEEVVALYNATKTYHNFTDLNYGNYSFTAYAVDEEGILNYTEERNVEIINPIDLNPPYFTDISNQTIYNNQALNYDINASDESSFDSFAIDDTTNFTIDASTGVITNITGLTIGTYVVNVTINDSANNLNSTLWQLDVLNYNITPPYFDHVLADQNLYNNQSLNYDINATDGEGNFDSFAINWTENFTIDASTGVLTNSSYLVVGEHYINVTINDSANNLNSSVILVNVSQSIDSTPPYFTDISNQTIYNNQSLNYDINASDESSFDSFAIDDTTNFTIDASTGVITNITGLNVGIYVVNVTINDSANNLNSTLWSLNVTSFPDVGGDSTPPWINFTLPTPLNASNQTNTDIYVNYSVSDPENDNMYSFINFDDSLVGWWRFDNDSSVGENSTLVYDWSGNGNNGTFIYNGTGGLISNGSFGGAGYFDADGDWVVLDPARDINSNYEYTISVWLKKAIADSNSTDTFMTKLGGANDIFYIRVTSNDLIQFTVYNESGSVQSAVGTPSNSVQDTNWHHTLIRVWNVGAGIYNYSVWLDGIEYEVRTMKGLPSSGSSADFKIGADWFTNSPFNGSLDEVLILDRGLSDEEIVALYNASSTYHNFTNLGSGNHTFTAYVVDENGNLNYTEERNVDILDVIPPYFTDISNQTIYNNQSLNYDINATDGEGNFDSFAIDDTTNFTIDASTGVITNITGLTIGTYIVNVTINDSANNLNSTLWQLDVAQEVIPPTSNRFALKDSSGNDVGIIDSNGNMYLASTKHEGQGSLGYNLNSFIITNSLGTVISYIDNAGELYLLGGVTEFSDLSGRTSSNLEFRNSTNDLIAFFDNVGNLKLKGSLYENYSL